MLLFTLTLTSILVSGLSRGNLEAQRRNKTVIALAQAKEALIGRAVLDMERPGSLPCPDFNDDGKAVNGSCSVTVGRLPWRTLDLPDLRDGDGNHLWYVLSAELRDNDTSPPINPNQALSLTLDGATNIAAIVFSAGPPLAGQNGRPSNTTDDYLDSTNKSGGPYISGPDSTTFNDKTISISRDQLFKVVNRKVLGLLSTELKNYYTTNANLFPESGTDLKTALESLLTSTTEDEKKTALQKKIEMFDKNGWFVITHYTAAPDRQLATLTITVPTTTTCTVTPADPHACTDS
jgi:hypothetical protein